MVSDRAKGAPRQKGWSTKNDHNTQYAALLYLLHNDPWPNSNAARSGFCARLQARIQESTGQNDCPLRKWDAVIKMMQTLCSAEKSGKTGNPAPIKLEQELADFHRNRVKKVNMASAPKTTSGVPPAKWASHWGNRPESDGESEAESQDGPSRPTSSSAPKKIDPSCDHTSYSCSLAPAPPSEEPSGSWPSSAHHFYAVLPLLPFLFFILCSSPLCPRLWHKPVDVLPYPPCPPPLAQVLGVGEFATAAEIILAYREKARLHHPDKGGCEDTFKDVQAAYATLSSEMSRGEYDSDVGVQAGKRGLPLALRGNSWGGCGSKREADGGGGEPAAGGSGGAGRRAEMRSAQDADVSAARTSVREQHSAQAKAQIELLLFS